MQYTRILSIDGGGIKGIIPATILVALEKMIQKYSEDADARLADYFDLIAGTSTGGLLSLLYLIPDTKNPTRPKYTAAEVLSFYKQHGEKIFSSTLRHSLITLNGLIGAKYSTLPYESLLSYYFFDLKLGSLLKPCLIPAYELHTKRAVFFNQQDTLKPHKNDFFVKDIARATSAAPTYFSPARIKSTNGIPYTFIDGGVFANNPALCACVEALKLPQHPKLSNLLLLSLGTGQTQTSYKQSAITKGGMVQWVFPLFNIFTSNMTETVDTQLRCLFNDLSAKMQYLRIQAPLIQLGYPEINMDDASNHAIQTLEEIGLILTYHHHDLLEAWAQALVSKCPPVL